MLREAGEVKLTSSLKIQNNTNAPHTVVSPSFDLAASPVKGLGIIASYRSTNRYADENDIYDYSFQDSIRYSGSRAEFGVGYYLPFGSRGLFDIYGGVGFGSVNRDNLQNYYGNYEAKYFQVFLLRQLQCLPMLSIGFSKRMRRFIRFPVGRSRKFIFKIPFRQFYRVHSFQRQMKQLVLNGACRQIYNLLRQVDRSIMILAYFTYEIGIYLQIIHLPKHSVLSYSRN